MGKFDGILICSDFDMTMGRGGVVTDGNCEAIRYFQENGGRFTIISGRNPHFLKTHQNGFCVNAPLVGYNGALIMDERTEEVLYAGGRPDMLALDLAERLWRENEHLVRVVMHDGSVDTYACHRVSTDVYLPTVADLKQRCQLPLYNVLCVGDTPENATEIKQWLLEAVDGEFEIARSWDLGVEIICHEDSKGVAARRLKKMLGARLLVTVGDYENDITMLQMGDISYAVENALPHVKAAAKRETVHYEQSAIAAIVAELEREL